MRARRDERGLVALDWMLIFAGVVGAAVGTTVVLQNFFEESAYEGADPIVRVIEADIAAARIAAEAQRLFERDREDNRALCQAPSPVCTAFNLNPDSDEYSGSPEYGLGVHYPLAEATRFEQACEDLLDDFSDVLDAAKWHHPIHPWRDPNHHSLGLRDDKIRPARCVLTPKPLG